MFVQCLEICSQTKLHQVEESLRAQDTRMEFSKGRFDVQLWKVELQSVHDIGFSSFRGSAACKSEMHLYYIRYNSVCWKLYDDVYQLSDRGGRKGCMNMFAMVPQ